MHGAVTVLLTVKPADLPNTAKPSLNDHLAREPEAHA